jgi:adenine-specific DNA-methyltransferase
MDGTRCIICAYGCQHYLEGYGSFTSFLARDADCHHRLRFDLRSDRRCKALESPHRAFVRSGEHNGAVIKYLGSKRRLLPVLGALARQIRASTALDLFTGTTRVAQEFKRQRASVWALDSARYSKVLADCYIATDARNVDTDHLQQAVDYLNTLSGYEGYFTQTFCKQARYFQPHNGRRIDAIRDTIQREFQDSVLYPILLSSLMEAADRVDSTTGVQMAYLKNWSPRSYQPLRLDVPRLLPGDGVAVHADATRAVSDLPPMDLAYMDPPYNQHSFFANYHIWETLVAWDAPAHYGVACKRVDCRDRSTKSPFNSRRTIHDALAAVVGAIRARVLVVSYNNESFVSLTELREICSCRGEVEVLAFDSRRYVGAQIGIYSPSGRRVGRVSHLHNIEYLLISGDKRDVNEAVDAVCGSNTSAPLSS